MNRSSIRSNEEWKYWGKVDPLYGVLTDPQKRKGGSAPWEENEFYKVGEEHWAALWPHWQSYGVQIESCLEIGCGVGRMTRQLAHVFRQVHAIDVAEGMIQMARSKSPSNVSFYLTNGLSIPLPTESVTAAFSMHVLQHLDSIELQTEYFRGIYSVLCRGGTMLVHLPIYKFPFSGVKIRKLYDVLWLRNRLRNRLKRLLLRMGINVSLMEFTEMPLEQVFVRLSKIGFQNIEIRMVSTHAHTQIHPLIFARKS